MERSGPGAGGKVRVLLIYRKLIPSIRLCGHSQLEWLAKKDVIEYRAIQEMRLSAADMDWADIAVLGRLDSWYERRLTRMLKAAGRRLLYILDDDLLNIPRNISSAGYYAQPDIRENIREMIGLSDGILSPSPRLMEKYAEDKPCSVLLEEPAIDPVAYAPHAQDAPVKIGFAGSIDRAGNLNGILREALTQIKRDYGDGVAFEFFGAIPDFAAQLGARSIPYCDSYEAYRRRLNEAAWDIGLAPMERSEFCACKHYNKFSEYAAAGIVGLYSDCPPYTRIPDPGPVARFCGDAPEDWVAALRGLIDDRAELEALRRRCCQRANGPLSLRMCAEALWRELSKQPVNDKPRQPIRRALIDLKAVNIPKRGMSYIRCHGIGAPLKAARKLADAVRGND